MLKSIAYIDDDTTSRLMSVYSESMEDLKSNFDGEAEMRAAYAAFLRDFIANPRQLILAEASGDEWVSALRAIETAQGHWFLEAVETKPEERGKGYGKALLRHTLAHLSTIAMQEVTCTISKKNVKSQALHGKCGFAPTEERPVNCWGELEEGTVLYRFVK